MRTEAPRLSAIPSTLRIPLTARAMGGRLFPRLAVDDRFAADALAYLGDDGQQWLRDWASVYGSLRRIHYFRDQARAFLARAPAACVVSLGCGLSDYLQWLDNGQMRMIDADLPEVMAIRRKIMPPQNARHTLADLDLNDAHWWDTLGLPATREAAPVCLMSEGVFMYLQPAVVQAVLGTIGERAPVGSALIVDAMCWLTVGNARYHTSVRHTDAEFHWGLRQLADLVGCHRRFVLRARHSVMDGYSPFYAMASSAFSLAAGIEPYAIYMLEVKA
ncbi:MAG: class I SAM-dependent methyltransferase [Burkholderiaceae bacterium]|jgi:O-methyltransferase involved in polyketide biosynthesis|nr:class I SAM-dependent methyltransferase [Burkholderiaceae bacterium]